MIGQFNLHRYRGEGRVDKQTGGPGQKAYCVLELEAQDRGAGFTFVNRVTAGAIPREFIPSIEKGVRSALSCGILAGFPVVDVLVSVVDGNYHAVDSSDYAFAEAARLAFRDACQNAPMIVIEPIGLVEVTAPGEYLGAIIGDFNRRRGQIIGQHALGDGTAILQARVPVAETFGFATDLRSMSQGRASFSMTVDGYEEVPISISQRLIARHDQKIETRRKL
jgi:elongation factor G